MTILFAAAGTPLACFAEGATCSVTYLELFPVVYFSK